MIWESLDPPATVEEVVHRVCARVGDSGGDVAGDVSDFIASLAARRFVITNAS